MTSGGATGLSCKGVFGKASKTKFHALKGTADFKELQRRAREATLLNTELAEPTSGGSSSPHVESASANVLDAPSEIALATGTRISDALARAKVACTDLAVVGQQGIDCAVTRLRSALRTAARQSADQAHVRDMQLATSCHEQSSALGGKLASNFTRLDGVDAQASPPTYKRVIWKLPVIASARAVALGAKEPQRNNNANEGETAHGLHSKLRASWANRSPMYIHKDQKKLGKIPPSQFTASPCRHLGMHICDRVDLQLFRASFIAILRRMFKKESSNPHKKPIEDAHYVLRLEWIEPATSLDNDLPTSTDYVHVSLANQLSWACALTRLSDDYDGRAVRAANALGHLALRAAVDGHDKDINDPFKAMGLDLLPRIFTNAKLNDACIYTICQIFDSKRELTTFVPAQIEVVPQTRMEFWPGLVKAREQEAKAKAKGEVSALVCVPCGDPSARAGDHGGEHRGEHGGGGDDGGEHGGGGPGLEADPPWYEQLHHALVVVDHYLQARTFNDPSTRPQSSQNKKMETKQQYHFNEVLLCVQPFEFLGGFRNIYFEYKRKNVYPISRKLILRDFPSVWKLPPPPQKKTIIKNIIK